MTNLFREMLLQVEPRLTMSSASPLSPLALSLPPYYCICSLFNEIIPDPADLSSVVFPFHLLLSFQVEHGCAVVLARAGGGE